MKIAVSESFLALKFFGLREFPRTYKRFHDDAPATTVLEREGADLTASGFDDVVRVNEFVRGVFKWGGRTGNRVRGQVYKHQTEDEVAAAVGRAAKCLREGKLKPALCAMIAVRGLHISYGSKILRMLAPEQAGVYDSLLANFFSYPLDESGYAEFCQDCGKVAAALQALKIKHPLRKGGAWLIADVEAVIFGKLIEEGHA